MKRNIKERELYIDGAILNGYRGCQSHRHPFLRMCISCNINCSYWRSGEVGDYGFCALVTCPE